MKKALLVSLLAASLGACSSFQTVEQAQEYAPCMFPDSPQDKAPIWICDVMPKDVGAGAMGYAKKSVAGLRIMRKVAMTDARANLASQFETKVKDTVVQSLNSEAKSSDEKSTEKAIEKIQNETKTIVDRGLQNTKVIVSQMSPKGNLYILVGMDKQDYQANIDKLNNEVKKQVDLWNKFNNEKAQKEVNDTFKSLK